MKTSEILKLVMTIVFMVASLLIIYINSIIYLFGGFNLLINESGIISNILFLILMTMLLLIPIFLLALIILNKNTSFLN